MVTKIPKSNGVVVGFRWAGILKEGYRSRSSFDLANHLGELFCKSPFSYVLSGTRFIK